VDVKKEKKNTTILVEEKQKGDAKKDDAKKNEKLVEGKDIEDVEPENIDSARRMRSAKLINNKI